MTATLSPLCKRKGESGIIGLIRNKSSVFTIAISSKKMPLKVENKCHICEKTDSQFWKTTDTGVICYECSEKPLVSLAIKVEEPDSSNSNGESKNLRKSTRATRFKSKSGSNNSKQAKGRSRRAIFKKAPQKTPNIQNVTRTAQSVFYKVSSHSIKSQESNY